MQLWQIDIVGEVMIADALTRACPAVTGRGRPGG